MAEQAKRRYVRLVRNKDLTAHARTIDDFIRIHREQAAMFSEWKRLGVRLDPDSGVRDDYAEFFTTDPYLAGNLGFLPEQEE